MASNLRVDTILPSTGTSLGIGTASGTTTVTNHLNVTGNLGIGGTLTYEDVTNVDSVGVITARQGIRIGAGQSIGSDGAAVVYYGDGSNLTGAGPTLANGANNRVVTATGAAALNAESGFTFDGTDVQVPDKILLNTSGSSIKSNQLRFQSGGAAYIDQYNTSQSINIRVSSSSALDTTAMTINHNGHITKPAHPILSMTVSNSVLSGNYMTHNSVLTNNGSHYNTSTSKFVCPVAGFYYASIMVMSSNSNTTMDLELHINGSNANNILVPYQAATGGQYNQVSGSCILQCAANAELQFKLNSGSIYSGRHSNITFALFA